MTLTRSGFELALGLGVLLERIGRLGLGDDLRIGGGVSALAVSSSDMPFLKALMPCATSPISSEILPRPNSSRTTAITTIQCQILNEPIEKSSAPSGGRAASSVWPEPRRKGRQKQERRVAAAMRPDRDHG